MEMKLNVNELNQVKKQLTTAILALEDYHLYMLPLHADSINKIKDIVYDIYRLYYLIDKTNQD